MGENNRRKSVRHNMIQILRTYKNLPDPVADFAFDEQLHPLLHLSDQDAASRSIDLRK